MACAAADGMTCAAPTEHRRFLPVVIVLPAGPVSHISTVKDAWSNQIDTSDPVHGRLELRDGCMHASDGARVDHKVDERDQKGSRDRERKICSSSTVLGTDVSCLINGS